MSSVADGVPEQRDQALSSTESEAIFTITIGATVPTGFEPYAADEVKEKIGVEARISKERGRIYFPITTDKLFQVHRLRSVDNLFVIVEKYDDYQFRDSKEETLKQFEQLASKLPWDKPLDVWKLNKTLKKRKSHRKGGYATKGKPNGVPPDVADAATDVTDAAPDAAPDVTDAAPDVTDADTVEQEQTQELSVAEGEKEESMPDSEEAPPETKLIKFRVTCSRVGDKHNFSSNEAARDFGGAVQEFFQWKADMTKFDIEVLLNIHYEEVIIGIALTEESLHRRNISHFGPTTLRATICYGMLRMCKPVLSDIVLDPMCGTGAIPVEGAIEFNNSFYVAGDNNHMAVNRTVNNVCHIQKRRENKGNTPGLPIDTVQWDLCHLPMRNSSVDVIITDMPFGKRMGSRKKNWDLYPSCLREMARVCRPGTGRAVVLTQDKKCFAKAISRMGGLWKKQHTVWVNVGGLHAGVYLLKRTQGVFGQTPENVYESQEVRDPQEDKIEDRNLP